jgi:hypothetical protein
MTMSKLIIIPQTRVGELLDAYPEIEELLFALSPKFTALKNPVLRRTVGRVATLSQAAAVGGLKVDALVNSLREAVGQERLEGSGGTGSYLSDSPPEWFRQENISVRFDATPIINAGESPMAGILSMAGKLKGDDILEVSAPFVPAPVLDILTGKGFRVFSVQKGDVVRSYVKIK